LEQRLARDVDDHEARFETGQGPRRPGKAGWRPPITLLTIIARDRAWNDEARASSC